VNTVELSAIKKINLPKRDIQVLIGGNSPIQSEYMTFGVATVAPKTKMDPHVHDKEEEIIYILSGSGYVEIDGEKENLKKDTVIKLLIGKQHCIFNESNEEMQFVFCFNPPLVIGSYDNE